MQKLTSVSRASALRTTLFWLQIGWLGAAPPYRLNISGYTLPYLTSSFFFYGPIPTRPLNRFARTLAQTTWIDPRKCLFEVLPIEKFFRENILPLNFQMAFFMQIEKFE
jgi:hypothetical protein